MYGIKFKNRKITRRKGRVVRQYDVTRRECGTFLGHVYIHGDKIFHRPWFCVPANGYHGVPNRFEFRGDAARHAAKCCGY